MLVKLYILSIIVVGVIGFTNGTKTDSRNSVSPNRNLIYDFATNLYLSISKFKEINQNMLISPFSIRTISALIYLAARGPTADEISEALLLPKSHEDLIEGLEKQMTSTKNVQNSIFDIGNGVFIREGVYLNRSYAGLLHDKLRSKITKCNFNSPRIASGLINNWVANITKNRIKRLVDETSLSPTTSVFMGNALYFSGAWNEPFDENSTRNDRFILDNGIERRVEMMQTENSFYYSYIRELEATGISIPFKDNRFDFIILKPDKNLSSLEAKLVTYPLNSISNEIRKENRNVLLRIPKFRLDVHYDLVDVMKNLGIKSLFDSTLSDLSGLTKSGDKHFVSKIVHRTALVVSEKGADAAAGTGLSFYPISAPSFFTVDKPFLFLLTDRLTGPLFIGRLADPNQAHLKL